MLARIEDAIVARIEEKLAATAGMVAVQRGIDGIPQPAVYVSTEAARFEKVGQETFRQILTIFVDIVFSELSGERERRKGVYLVLEGVLQALLLQDLGLAIKPLAPQGWKNTTTEELRKAGLIAFALELHTSCMISRLDDAAVSELLAVGLNYYLTPGDDIVDASDTVTLQEAEQ